MNDSRGVSELVGALILIAVNLSAGAVMLQLYSKRAGLVASGILQASRLQERRMRQLLSLVHSYDDPSTGTCVFYLYSYGSEPVTLKQVWVNEAEVRPSLTDTYTDLPLENLTIPPGTLAKMVTGRPGGPRQLTLLTSLGAIYSWRLG
jgi:flagellin-like protein